MTSSPRTFMLAVWVAVATIVLMQTAHAGKLARAAEAVDAPSSNASDSKSSRRDRNRRERDCDDDDGILDYILGGLFSAVFNGSSSNSESDYYDLDCTTPVTSKPPRVELYYTEYPYEYGYPGYMASASLAPTLPRETSRQVWVDYGTNFDDIHSVGTALRMAHKRVGFDMRWRNYFEDLGPDGTDELGLGGVGGFFQFGQSERRVMRVGIGVPMMAYENDFDAGITFATGIDLFPTEPWIMSFDAEFGKLGSASFTRLRPTLGFTYKRTEFLTGVEYVKIEDVDFTNMIFGVRVWW
jgi:hypothetical protein